MHKNIEPSGVTLLSLLLAIAILIGLIIQSFALRNIEDKIDNFSAQDSTIYSSEQTIVAAEEEGLLDPEEAENKISN